MSEASTMEWVENDLDDKQVALESHLSSEVRDYQEAILSFRARQQELDHREALLNARVATLESQFCIETLTLQKQKEYFFLQQKNLEEWENRLKILEKEIDRKESLFLERSRQILAEIESQMKNLHGEPSGTPANIQES